MTLTAEEKQVVALVRSLDPQRRRYVLLEIARGNKDGWRQFHQEGVAQLRELARQRGLEWERLDEEQRQQFIETLPDGEGA